jgi:hypothetical protein
MCRNRCNKPAISSRHRSRVRKHRLNRKWIFWYVSHINTEQIRVVTPDATSIQKSYIPNITLLVVYNDSIMTLPSQPDKVIIKINDKIRCYDKDNKEIYIEVEEVIDNRKFRIKPLELPYDDKEIFVYGTEIDDFHTISK